MSALGRWKRKLTSRKRLVAARERLLAAARPSRRRRRRALVDQAKAAVARAGRVVARLRDAKVRDFADLSEHNGSVDWAAYGRTHDLVIVRVSDGDRHDRLYGPERVSAIRRAGLVLGVYHYARVASPANGQRGGAAEAGLALRLAKAGGWGRAGELPLAYDFEDANDQPFAKCAHHLIQFVWAYRDQAGHYPLIYTMPGFWGSVLAHLTPGELETIARCPLWEAHWNVSHPLLLRPWSRTPRPYAMHQFTDSGTAAGVSGGGVDLSHFQGRKADLARLTMKEPIR